jgi:hypothetical protein
MSGWRRLRALGRLRATLTYGGLLLAVTSALVALGPHAQARAIERASTNLHNLGHGHVGTLLGSAFVVDAGPIALWLPGLLCLLGLGESIWGSRQLIYAFVTGHVGATLLVAIGLTAAVESGWTSADITRATDVGTSYGATAVLGALAVAVPGRWRPAVLGAWLGVGVAAVAVGRDFTDVGHGVALLLGMAVATRFGAPGAWTGWRLVLLGVASWFGFLMLAGTVEAMAAAAACGAAGSVVAGALTATRRAYLGAAHDQCGATPRV